jgi:membrane protein DedA with SNARE-associated domain
MQNRKFWIYNTLGSVIYATTITLIGVFLFDQYETIINNFEKIMLSIIVIFALYIFLYKKTSVKAYVESKKKEWE